MVNNYLNMVEAVKTKSAELKTIQNMKTAEVEKIMKALGGEAGTVKVLENGTKVELYEVKKTSAINEDHIQETLTEYFDKHMEETDTAENNATNATDFIYESRTQSSEVRLRIKKSRKRKADAQG